MRKTLRFVLLPVLFFFAYSCVKEDIYDRPEWLTGKIYTQIKDQPELSAFARCIQLVGYDSVINVSGSYTVFAPNNDAFDLFFEENPGYGSVENIPLDELARIVKFHIVQNPWNTDQLRQLDIHGWIDSLDLNNDEPRGFKRETLLRDKNTNYGVDNSFDGVRPGEDRKLIIVDTLQTSWLRRQITDARKYAPLFYQEYFDIYKLTSEDFAFYFNRPFESASMYFVNARIVRPNIFAENGFVHIIDRVVTPLKNAYQFLKTPTGANSYSNFLDLINTFPEFSYNEEETFNQPGADMHAVDSLFDITYPDLVFSIVNEKTLAPKGATDMPGNVTIRYHHGLVAPTNTAFDDFVSEYLTGPGRWGSLLRAPASIRKIFVNTHMAAGPIYPSNINRGFYNGEDDLIQVDQSTIVEQKFGSNATFMGVNKALVPRAFSSVAGPVYLQRGYSRVMTAIEKTGLLPALKRQGNNYSFFVENDENLGIDSSLIYDVVTEDFFVYNISGAINIGTRLTITDLRNLILNHIGTELPNQLSRREFIRNLAGNYLVIDNETGEVRGNVPTTFGYLGSQVVQIIPDEISDNADNGKTYDIANWFNFRASDLFTKISTDFPAFHNLLVTTGLANTSTYTYNFLSPDENYTVFAPTADALAAYPHGSLTTEQLKKFLMMHFVQGTLIFTDGRKPSGFYETARIDEKSTQYTKLFTKIYIEPLPDFIRLRADDGTTYLSVEESPVTNKTVSRVLNNTGGSAFPTMVTNAVIHSIDKVLVFDEMDTE